MPPAEHTALTRDQSLGLSRGTAIGRYIVLGLVGKGAMGEVYGAYDPELDRKIAIKLLRVQPGGGAEQLEGRTRLMREAQAIAKVSHPNVVVVYDVGTFAEQVFIAMEFVEGHTVGYWIHAQPRSWTDVLKIFAAAGHGLMAAHDKDLVHRDFKPDNVMISADGQVRVMDFGLARHTGESWDHKASITPTASAAALTADEDVGSTRVLATAPSPAAKSDTIPALPDSRPVQLTRTGTMVGTPAYMAPEQFRAEATDVRTDQFSFCVALYEALYGERPFEGQTVPALEANVVAGRLREAPADAKVPLWLRKVLLRGLSARPAERWPSMKALLAELERNRVVARRRPFAAGAAAKLATIWELPRTKRTPEPRVRAEMRQAFIATGKHYAATAFENTCRILDRYAKSWSDMYTDACEATHVRGEQSTEVLDLRMTALQEALGGLKALVQTLNHASGEVVENAVNAANALPSIDRCANVDLLRAVVKPPADPATRAVVERLRDDLAQLRTLSHVGRLADGFKLALTLEEAARRVGYGPLLSEVLLALGHLHIELRDFAAAARAFEESVWTAELSRHDEVAAEAAAQIVAPEGELRPEVGEVWARHAEMILRRIGGHERLWGWFLNNRGLMRRGQGRLADALDDIARAVAFKEKALGPEDPDLAISLGNLSMFVSELGDASRAVEPGERCLKILEAGLGAEHPKTALHQSNHAEILNRLGRFAEARAVCEPALATIERETDPEGVFITYPMMALARACLGEGDSHRALPLLERAVRIRDAKERTPALLGEAHFALARALWETGTDLPRAKALLARARAEYAEAPQSPLVASEFAELERWVTAREGAARPASRNGLNA